MVEPPGAAPATKAPAGGAEAPRVTSGAHDVRATLRPTRDRAPLAGASGRASAPGRSSNDPGASENAYVLEMLPYPSGEPHIGHLKNYALGDAIAHFRRRTGARVLHPMGYDAFGLPAENHAIRTGVHPRVSTENSIAAVPAGVPLVGDLDRLVTRVLDPHARVLPLDPVDLPAAVRARARLPQGGGGQVVPERRDGARQRAGDRRPLRALRRRGRAAPARAVVLPDHRLRRAAARRPRRRSAGPSTSRRCSATGSAAARGPRSTSAARSSGSTIRCSRPARTRCSARPSS